MHSLLKHIHGGDQHGHDTTEPQTTGALIRWAKYYDLVVQLMALGQAGHLRRKSIDAAQIKPGERILDVGCGTGDLTLLAKERAGATGQVCGIDAAPEMIDVARDKAAHVKAEVDFRAAVIEQSAVPRGIFRRGVEQLDDASPAG